MAQYVTDMTKRPIEMLLGLINNDNGFGFVESDVEILAPQTQDADEAGRNTSVMVDLEELPSEAEDDFVTFTYERIDLQTLFGQASPSFRQVDVPLNGSGVPEDSDVFYTELLRKFGVAFNEADFSYVPKSAGVITIAAAATNLAYIGEFDITVGSSLATRVPNVILAGFEIPAEPVAEPEPVE